MARGRRRRSRPGRAAQSSRASSAVIGRSVSTRIDSLCENGTGHADAGRADVDRRVAHDLAGLVDHLHLFLGVAARAGNRRYAGCSCRRSDGRTSTAAGRRARRRWASVCASSSWMPFHARPRDRLVGADDDAPDPRGVVQRLERDDHLDGRAVGVGDDPLGASGDVVGIDLGHDQRDVGVHPEGARVVDDHGAGRGGDRAPFAGDARRRAREHDLDARERSCGERLRSGGLRPGTSPSCPHFARRPGT